MTEIIDTPDARQGDRHKTNLRVLRWSLAVLAVISLGAIVLVG